MGPLKPPLHGYSTRLFLVLLALMFASPAFCQLTPGELVNVAGSQRMLSQRIVKAYAQAAQDVHKETSTEQLKSSLDLFEEHIRVLKAQSPNENVREGLARIEELWKPFAATARGTISREGASRLLRASEPLLQACQATVTQIESALGVTTAKIVNIAGRQRMLSQRLTKSYMFLNWGFRDESLSKELAEARAEFESAHEQLRQYPQNTAEINSALADVGKDWEVFRQGFEMRERSGKYIPLFVANAGDHILETMDKVTGMYARLGPATTR